jgi:hypothetical protein
LSIPFTPFSTALRQSPCDEPGYASDRDIFAAGYQNNGYTEREHQQIGLVVKKLKKTENFAKLLSANIKDETT